MLNSLSSIYSEVISGRFFRTYFGGRLPFLRYYTDKLFYYLGGYRAQRRIDWWSVRRLVFVCKGNINRSPFAEYYCKSKAVDSVSIGLDTSESLPASDEALRNALSRGIDLSAHRTWRLSDFPVKEGDLFITFESSQADFLQNASLGSGVQVTLIGLWGDFVCPYIQDPICREDRYFQTCYHRIEKSVDGIVKRMTRIDGGKN